jgi:hypothetical protein
MVFKMLLLRDCHEKNLHLKAYELSIFQYLQRGIVCTPLSVNILVTLPT